MKYYLAEACENTFVLMDCLQECMDEQKLLNQPSHYLKMENRDDALILTQGKCEGGTLYARMLVLGLDGSLGEFCGNGSRSCAAYLYEQYPGIKQFYLTTPHGVHPLMKHAQGVYSIKLPPARFEINTRFIAQPAQFKSEYEFHYVEMIEPHLIIQKPMTDEELFLWGRQLNSRKEMFPLGININAWCLLPDGSLYVKTYERGVQRLTRSCGTGSMSCAAFYCRQGNVHVYTPGGNIDICVEGDGIILKGPASFF